MISTHESSRYVEMYPPSAIAYVALRPSVREEVGAARHPPTRVLGIGDRVDAHGDGGGSAPGRSHEPIATPTCSAISALARSEIISGPSGIAVSGDWPADQRGTGEYSGQPIEGLADVGKSHLAQALGHEVCRRGFDVGVISVARMLGHPARATSRKRNGCEIESVERSLTKRPGRRHSGGQIQRSSRGSGQIPRTIEFSGHCALTLFRPKRL